MRLAVLDCDLIGFSGLAARMAPEAVAAALRAYHGFVEELVFTCGGAVLAWSAKLLCGTAAAKARAGGQDRAGAQVVDRGVGLAAPRGVLRRRVIHPRLKAGRGKVES